MTKPFIIIALAALGGLAGFAMGWKSVRRDVPASDSTNSSVKTSEREAESTQMGQPEPASASTSATKAPATGQATAFTPKKQFLSLVFQRWSKQARQHVLWELFLENSEAQKRLFEYLMTTASLDECEAGQDFLIGTRDGDLVRRMADAFASETHPDRRAMLAYALGGNAGQEAARPGIEQALDSRNEALLRRVLTRFSLANLTDSPDAMLRLFASLKGIVESDLGQEVRVAAVGAMRGGAADNRTRYLLNLALSDSNPRIQRAAVNSLPIGFMSHSPLLEEQVDGLWILARDESRDENVRRSAASLLWNHARFNRGVKLSDADQVLLKTLVNSNK